jgi:hypothetical protein
MAMRANGEATDHDVFDSMLVQVLQQRYGVKGVCHAGMRRRSGWRSA